MGLWGPPNIQKLKEKKDINGLNKLLRSEDYEIRKESILALLEIGGMLDPIDIVIDLLRDDSSEIRKKAYEYSFAGNLGIMLNIVGIHDEDPELRLRSLEILKLSEKDGCIRELISRSANLDPDENVRKKSVSIIVEQPDEIDLFIPIKQVQDSSLDSAENWFSILAIYNDLLFYIDASWPGKENIVYKSKYGVLVPFKSALMEGCKTAFLNAGSELQNNSIDNAYNLLNAIVKYSVEGLNGFSEVVPFTESIKQKKLPYQDYMIASIILIVLIEKIKTRSKHNI